MKEMIHALWAYRYFILSSVTNEFRSRFIRSKLGGLWMVIHPLAQVLVYALILSQIMRAKLPGIDSQYAYPIYILAGMVGWSLFFEIITRSLTIFIDNANLLKKISFPKLALPFVIIGSSLVNFAILTSMMFIVFSFLGHTPYHAIYWLPLLVLLTLALAVGLGLILGTLNVFIRDVGQVMTVVMQFWFWLTPVVYTLSIVPKEYHHLFFLNPLTGIISGYQNVLVYDKAPDLSLLIYPATLALFSLLLALVLFKKANREMADLL